MARRRTAVAVAQDQYTPVIAEYRKRLSRPAPPPQQFRWAPVTIGPTWQRTEDGFWLLPERTLGWAHLGWAGVWLQHRRGVPWRYTDEQARFILWWYALEPDGEFVFRDGVLQRLKGWGKDPVGACLCAGEAFGPSRFLDWDSDGEPLATDCEDAWVQTAAVSLEQTKNTMRLFPRLFTEAAKAEYQLQIGKEQVHGCGGERIIQAVTSSPATLEGARATFVLPNETQHWNASNSGHEMADVIERNATKSADGAARTLRITNAFEDGEDSVGQRDREAWEDAQSGAAVDTGIMYDSLEAAPDAPLALDTIAVACGLGPDEDPTREQIGEVIGEVVRSVRGDSVWLNLARIIKSILDKRNSAARSRRFWYNQVDAAEDAWIDPKDLDQCPKKNGELRSGDEIVLFIDCSKSDDATGLVGCRISDGAVGTLGMWQPPPKKREGSEKWLAPRAAIDHAVDETFETYKVVAFWGDPSHTRDDETQERYWDGLFDEWHRRYGDQLELWAVPGKQDGHAVMWDMTSPARVEQFTAAAERTQGDIAEHVLLWDGDGRLRSHARNARRAPNRWGVSLAKKHRESKRKIDLAVCMVGARMLRRLVLNNPKRKKKRSGKVW